MQVLISRGFPYKHYGKPIDFFFLSPESSEKLLLTQTPKIHCLLLYKTNMYHVQFDPPSEWLFLLPIRRLAQGESRQIIIPCDGSAPWTYRRTLRPRQPRVSFLSFYSIGTLQITRKQIQQESYFQGLTDNWTLTALNFYILQIIHKKFYLHALQSKAVNILKSLGL